MLEWPKDEDFWVRRIAIDHQLCWKEKTNTKLLEAILVNNFGRNESFINKAIVWSLRDYSKANFELVKEFVEKYKEKWTNNVGLMNGLVIDEWSALTSFISHSKAILNCKASSVSHVVIAIQRPIW